MLLCAASAVAPSLFRLTSMSRLRVTTHPLLSSRAPPTARTAGKGLTLLPTDQALAAAAADAAAGASVPKHQQLRVVQRYISDPLLVQGRKCHLRLWAVVTGIRPLRAYLHRWVAHKN